MTHFHPRRKFVFLKAAGLALALLSAFCAWANALSSTTDSKIPPHIRFKSIAPSQVEKLGYVNDIVRDKDGFLWIAALQGLARYDGYNIKEFHHDPENAHSLSHSWVKSLILDSQDRLWAVTNTGLCRFVPELDGFDCVVLQDSENPLQFQSFYALYEDSEGIFWASTSLGLKTLDPENGTFSEPPANIARALRPFKDSEDNFVIDIVEDIDGNLWFGLIGNGIIRYHKKTEAVFHFQKRRAKHNLPSNKILDLYLDSRGTLWAGTLGGGLNYFDTDNESFVHFQHSTNEKADTVWSVVQDKNGLFWIGDGIGVHIRDMQTSENAHYSYVEGETDGVGNFVVRKIYIDDTDGIWLGYFPSGVDRIDILASQFLNYRHKPDDKYSLADGGVLDTLEDEQGNIWVGCGFGLSYLDRSTQKFQRFVNDPDNPNSISGSTVLDMALDEDGSLWVGSWDRGLNRLDPERKRFERFQEDPTKPGSLLGREPWAIHTDTKGRLWVGTEKGINLYRPDTNDFEHILPIDSAGTALNGLYVRHISQSSSGNLWIASYNGLYQLDPDTGEYLSHYSHNPSDPTSLSSNQLLTVYEDGAKNIWIGTNGEGLNLFDPETETFKRYGLEDGLPHLTISGIIDDLSGKLWISTYQGLARFDTELNTITVFDERHGPVGNLYNRNSPSRLRSGELVFGSSRGLSIFNPGSIVSNTHIPDVAITDFSVFNKSVFPGENSPIKKAINWADEIVLNHDQSVFSFEFAALDFHSPSENLYAYRLVGFEPQWNEVGTRRTATYTNLDPGEYTLQIRASNNNGVWNPEPKEISIRIRPPLWKSAIAYVIYVAVFLATVLRALQMHRTKLKYEREKLEQERAIVKQLTEIDAMKDEINRDLDKKVAERTEELRREHEQLLVAQGELKLLNRKLEDASVTDPLTGLKNRRFLYQSIETDIATLERQCKANSSLNPHASEKINGLTFVVMDIDKFKKINDTYGHRAGDTVLVQLSNILTENLRESDFVVRWGGEEFVIVLRYLPRKQALSSIQRVFDAIKKHNFTLDQETSTQLTCSMGVASYPFYAQKTKEIPWEQVVNIADTALYCAKQSGRDCWISLESASKIIEEAPFFEQINQGKIVEEIKAHRLIPTSSKSVTELIWDTNSGTVL